MTPLPPPPKVKIYKRWWFWLLLVVGLMILAGIGLQLVTAGLQPAKVESDQTVTAQVRSLRKAISTTGKLVPEQAVDLAFLTSGKVTKMNVGTGDLVDKDQVLAQVGSVTLKAPFDGRVLAVNTFVDDTVVAGNPVLEVGYRSNVVEVVATESEIFDLAKGQSVELTIPSYENGATTYHGEVSFIDTKKNSASSNSLSQGTSSESGYPVQIKPTDLPEAVSSIVDLTVEVSVAVDSADNVLSIERGAVQYNDDDSAYVWIPATTDGGSPEKRAITTGFEGDDYIEITSGLSAGDSVALNIPAASVGNIF